MTKTGNSCANCVSCHENCSSCPKHMCQVDQMYLNNMKRVNKQVRMDSITRWIGTASEPPIIGKYLTHLNETLHELHN